jgi:hypothetical protein
MIVVLAVCFGALDQYLGSLWVLTHVGFWTADVSMMSAPWLALPLAVGAARRDAQSAAIWGAVATAAALLGYLAMTVSPVEGVATARVHLVAFLGSQLHVLLPGLVTGPVWGWLGYRWRTGWSRLSAVLIAGAFCLEPAARAVYGQPFRHAAVAAAEVLAGALLMTAMVVVGRRPTVS